MKFLKSIKNLYLFNIHNFNRAPFNLKEDKEIEKLSRYLIENDEKDYVFLDYSKSFEKEFVISSLKQLIGNYMIFTEQNEKDIIKQLQMV